MTESPEMLKKLCESFDILDDKVGREDVTRLLHVGLTMFMFKHNLGYYLTSPNKMDGFIT